MIVYTVKLQVLFCLLVQLEDMADGITGVGDAAPPALEKEVPAVFQELPVLIAEDVEEILGGAAAINPLVEGGDEDARPFWQGCGPHQLVTEAVLSANLQSVDIADFCTLTSEYTPNTHWVIFSCICCFAFLK